MHRNLECQVHESRQIGSGQTRDGKGERQHSRNQRTKMDWNAKVGSQETPGVTGKFGLGMGNEAGQKLIELCQENALVIANTLFQQHRKRHYTWTSPDDQYKNQINYILCSQIWRSSIQSTEIRLAD